MTSRPGLTYARARYYDSKLGVFLSRDTFEGVLLDAPSLHRYTYSHNAPLKYRDPTGRFIEEVVAVLTRPPMPYDTPDVAEIRKTLVEAPSVVAETYETGVGSMILDPAHAAATEATQDVAYGATGPLRSVGADTYANLHSAGVSAVGQFAVDAVFGAANLVLRPYRVVEGLGRLPGQVGEGVRVAVDSSRPVEQRVRGFAQALGAVSQIALAVLAPLKALGVEGPAVSLGRSVKPSPVTARPAKQEWWGGEGLSPRNWESSDPLLADLANTLEMEQPGRVINVNRKVFDRVSGRELTDIDIELTDANIQVKSGKKLGGAVEQAVQSTEATGKRSVIYAPRIPSAAARQAAKDGATVLRSEQELLQCLGCIQGN